MRPRRCLIAALVFLGLALASYEDSFLHTDDGCVLETHCNACLLRLGTSAVVAPTFSLPKAALLAERVAPLALSRSPEAEPVRVSSRGPPPRSPLSA